MRTTLITLFFASVLICLSVTVNAQKRRIVGRVCGDPMAACSTRQDFQAFELPFVYGKNSAISQSQFFYAVILKSVKLNADQSNCDKAISESDRTETQALFPHNMVFVMRCWESGQASYSNVSDGVSFMGVYAGPTQADANAFLAKVIATGKFKTAIIRRMRVLINGT
jgi:hypothetical protein